MPWELRFSNLESSACSIYAQLYLAIHEWFSNDLFLGCNHGNHGNLVMQSLWKKYSEL